MTSDLLDCCTETHGWVVGHMAEYFHTSCETDSNVMVEAANEL